MGKLLWASYRGQATVNKIAGKRFWLIVLLTLTVLGGCSNQPSTARPEPVIDEPVIDEPVTDEPVTDEPDAPVTPTFPGRDLTWRETVRSPVALYEAQGLAAGDLLYVFGGFYNEQPQASTITLAFNPARKRWHNLAPLPEKVTHAGQALFENKIYLAGGFVGDHPGSLTDHVWIYDVAADTWAAGPALPEKIGGGALVNLEGQFHFFGGTDREGLTYLYDSAEHWVLDVAAGSTTWVKAADLPNPRNHIAGAALGGKIYAVGGQYLGDEDSGNQRYVNVYDPAEDSWARAADLPQPLGHISAATFVYAGRLVVVMGTTQERLRTTEVIAYNPVTDSWEQLTNMPKARSSTVAGVIGGKIVLATGSLWGVPLDTTWIGSWDEDQTEDEGENTNN